VDPVAGQHHRAGRARLGEEAQDSEDAERAAADVRRRALTLVRPSPPVLSEVAPLGVDPGPVQAAWSKWAAVPDYDAPLTAAGLRPRMIPAATSAAADAMPRPARR
jgi:hypothetical protein